jgi:ornithine carbamoyltransferase
LFGRDLLSLRDLSPDEMSAVLVLADGMKKDPVKFSTALRSKTLAMVFEKPSLRTRVSFDVGMTQLGGHALDLSPEISLGKRESLHDVAKNLSAVGAIIIRLRARGLVRGGSPAFRHQRSHRLQPSCPGLADYMTMRGERRPARPASPTSATATTCVIR